MSVISMSGLTLGYLTLPLASAEGCPGLVFEPESARIGPRGAEPDRTDVERAVQIGTKGGDLAPERISPGVARRRVGIGDVLGNEPHAPSLSAQPRGGDRNRFQEIHVFSPRLPRTLIMAFRALS